MEDDYDEGILMVIRQGGRGARQSGNGDYFAEFSRLIEDGGSSAGVLYRDFARLWRNNQRALAEYKPGGVLSCPIVIFSTAQPLLPEEHKWLGIEDLPATEWQRYSSVPLEVITVPGDHYSLFVDADCRQVVADHLPAVLREASVTHIRVMNPAARVRSLPATAEQRRLALAASLRPRDPATNFAVFCRLPAGIDSHRMANAVRAVFDGDNSYNEVFGMDADGGFAATLMRGRTECRVTAYASFVELSAAVQRFADTPIDIHTGRCITSRSPPSVRISTSCSPDRT